METVKINLVSTDTVCGIFEQGTSFVNIDEVRKTVYDFINNKVGIEVVTDDCQPSQCDYTWVDHYAGEKELEVYVVPDCLDEAKMIIAISMLCSVCSNYCVKLEIKYSNRKIVVY